MGREARARGYTVRWDRNTAEDAEAKRAVDALLAKELTVDGAVQIALLASPRIRSTFEELAIAQADLVQAGLLKNPVFTIGTTAWDREHIDPNLFASVEQDFLDILTMPMRKRVAQAELESRRLRVGDEVFQLAAQVRTAFYHAQAAEQIASIQRLVNEAAEASAALARRQYDAGNINDLVLQQELGLASQTRLEAKRAEGEAAVAREELNKRMGLWGRRAAWKIGPRLPELPAAEPSDQALELVAMKKRLDVRAAEQELAATGRALSLVKTTRWTGVVNVNVEAGRLRDTHHFSFGPSVALEIPLFDQRQAAVARLEAFERQARNNLDALAIDARADVRATHARVLTQRAVVEEYGKVLVPLRENVVKFSQQQYDAMLIGVFQLLEAKRTEFETYRAYVDALRDYWIAKSDLKRATGG